MQYVKIGYSIPMEELPEKILSLMKDLEKPSTENHKKLKKVIELASNMGDIPTTIEELEALRNELYKIDMRLADCQSMLKGYHKSLNPELQTSTEEVVEQEETNFTPYDHQVPEHNKELEEKVKKKAVDTAMAEMKEQMDAINSTFKAAQNNAQFEQNEMFNQLPDDMKKMYAGMSQGDGQTDIMKMMMQKMMNGQGPKGGQ
jgi:chromosome segregation ATPase